MPEVFQVVLGSPVNFYASLDNARMCPAMGKASRRRIRQAQASGNSRLGRIALYKLRPRRESKLRHVHGPKLRKGFRPGNHGRQRLRQIPKARSNKIMNALLKLWKAGTHYPEHGEFVFVERERSRDRGGRRRPFKRAYIVLKVRPGRMDAITTDGVLDSRQFVTCRILIRKPKGRDCRYRWPLAEFLEKFERIK
jgi:hypothetical protein